MTTFPHEFVKQEQYGSFSLTDAIRPGPGLPIVPREGYRLGRYRDPESGVCLPILSAAVSADKLFEVFLDLLEPLGESVHAVLETSHDAGGDRHVDLRRGEIDLPVLKSHCHDYEELLLHDGCTGLAVVAPERRMEVQLDEHKHLFVYARDLKPFRRILRSHGIELQTDLRLLAEAAHVHHSRSRYADEFQQFAARLGAADFDSVLSDETGFAEW